MRRTEPRRTSVRVERLEDRAVPAFLAAPAYPAGPNGGDRSNPVAVATGDFNRDGKLDVATANFRAGGVSVLLGTGTGGLKPGANITLPLTPVDIIAADLNGDGKLDLVTANRGIFSVDGSVSVLMGNGLGGFTLARTIAVGKGPTRVAAADLNGDGKLDLAIANFGSNPNPGNTITLLMGTGTGAFTSGETVTVGSQPNSVAVGDFDGDGKPDLASVSGSPARLMINLGNGDGTFLPGNVYPTVGQPGKIVTGDFNHDGKLDVAIGSGSPSGIGVMLGNGDGTFGTFTNYGEYGKGVADLATADVNGDGNLDLVSANGQITNSVGVLLGNPDGSFGPAGLFTANEGPQGVAVGDVNGDGRPDVVAAGLEFLVGAKTENGCVAVLLGNGDGTLAAPRQLPVGVDPTANVAADFTGDGLPDLAVAFNDVQFSGASIFPNLGGGVFGGGLRTVPVAGPTGLATADFNGDGRPDLAVGTNNGVKIALGNGDPGGTFTVSPNYPTGLTTNTQVRWVATADFDGDDKPDVILATDSGVSVFLNNGDGTLQAAINTAGDQASNLVTGDFNGDGKTDVAVVSNPHAHLDILFGHGDGTFGTPTAYTTDTAPNAVGVGDFNGDGKPDLAVSATMSLGLEVFLAGSGGRFFPKATYATGGTSTGVIVADFNGDHKLDIATVDQHGDDVYVFPGTGLGTFGTPTMYVIGDRPMWGAAADLTGDGKIDLAVSNFNSGTLMVLESPAPVTGFRVVPAGPVTAGKPVGVTVSAVDATGHLVPSFTGSVKLTSTDPKAVLGLPYAYTATAFGTHRFVITPKTSGNQDVIAHFGALTGTGTVPVNAAKATHLKVIAPLTATAGSAFDLTVVAADPFGNPDPTFTGTVHFTSTDLKPGGSLPADYTFTGADDGTHTFSGGVTLATAGARAVTAGALGVHWLTPKASAKVTVTAGAVARFLVTGFPASIGANVAHTFTVTAQDAYGNTVTNYLGTVNFTSSDGSAVLPGPYTFTALNKGKFTFSAKFVTPGAGQWLAVTDANDASVTGSEAGINVA